MKRKLNSKLLCAAMALVLLVSCGQAVRPEGEKEKMVMLATATPAGGAGQLRLSGLVKEGGSISVGFKTAGQLATIGVKEGDYVRQGQLLATLDDADYRLGLDAAQAQYDQLRQEVERIEALYATGSISGNDHDKAVAGLRQVEANLAANRNKVEYTRLYAPASGYVQAVNFEVSEMVGAGTPVLTLIDTRSMEVWIGLPTSAWQQRGRMVGYTLCGPEGRACPLTLVSIAPKADASQLYRMRLALPPDGAQGLAAGMNVEVAVTLSAEGGEVAVALPVSALFEREGQTAVWLYDETASTVGACPVQVLSLDAARGMAVCGGLEPGARVVRAGVETLHEGCAVHPIEEPSATNIGGLI